MAEQRTFQVPGGGLKCGKCQAVLPRVSRTIKTPEFVMCERICLQCGEVNTTSERVINTRSRRRSSGDFPFWTTRCVCLAIP